MRSSTSGGSAPFLRLRLATGATSVSAPSIQRAHRTLEACSVALEALDDADEPEILDRRPAEVAGDLVLEQLGQPERIGSCVQEPVVVGIAVPRLVRPEPGVRHQAAHRMAEPDHRRGVREALAHQIQRHVTVQRAEPRRTRKPVAVLDTVAEVVVEEADAGPVGPHEEAPNGVPCGFRKVNGKQVHVERGAPWAPRRRERTAPGTSAFRALLACPAHRDRRRKRPRRSRKRMLA